MGYETWHELTILKNGEEISQELWKTIMAENVPSEDEPLDLFVGESQDWRRWYNDNVDMPAISARYPDLTFKLICEGEDGEHSGTEYFNGARTAVWQADLVWTRVPVEPPLELFPREIALLVQALDHSLTHIEEIEDITDEHIEDELKALKVKLNRG